MNLDNDQWLLCQKERDNQTDGSTHDIAPPTNKQI